MYQTISLDLRKLSILLVFSQWYSYLQYTFYRQSLSFISSCNVGIFGQPLCSVIFCLKRQLLHWWLPQTDYLLYFQEQKINVTFIKFYIWVEVPLLGPLLFGNAPTLPSRIIMEALFTLTLLPYTWLVSRTFMVSDFSSSWPEGRARDVTIFVVASFIVFDSTLS